MSDWLEPLTTAIQRDSRAVLVTVIAVGGSVPREVGATLVVSEGDPIGTTGTIGGGNLEYNCIHEAGEMLAESHVRHCKQISLGPALGQCCGGRVELLFELVTDETDWFVELVARHHANHDANRQVRDTRWLCRSLDGPSSLVATADELTQTLSSDTSHRHELNTTTGFVTQCDNNRWFYQPLSMAKPVVWVYGAGHVGQAVVTQLSLLECQVTLLDHRKEWQCLQPDLDISRVLTDTPEEDAMKAPDDAAHVVMTHSHSLDFDICHALLKRGQFGWLGLIGSDSKRQTFVNRLNQRGVGEGAIKRLRCPIGNLHLESSRPALISLNLAAELALHWQQTGNMR